MKDALFHPKVWLFQDGQDVMAAHGSSNVTYAGIRKNIEQVAVSKSWEDPNQRYITDKLSFQFEQLWQNKDDNCLVIGMPQAIRERLLRNYRSDAPPTEADLRALYGRATGFAEEQEHYEMPPVTHAEFVIPAELHYEDGPFEHQGKAVNAWCEADYQASWKWRPAPERPSQQ